jgi:hypothetical protein
MHWIHCGGALSRVLERVNFTRDGLIAKIIRAREDFLSCQAARLWFS